MDIDIPARSGADARLTELQSHYAKLEQEYRDVSARHEAQIQIANAHNARTERLESENADYKDQLQRCRIECQRLNNDSVQHGDTEHLTAQIADLQRRLDDAKQDSRRKLDTLGRLENDRANLQR